MRGIPVLDPDHLEIIRFFFFQFLKSIEIAHILKSDKILENRMDDVKQPPFPKMWDEFFPFFFYQIQSC